MTTELLFYDDEFQALRQMIEAGRGYKKTAAMLWPAMKPDSAYAKLKACCNGAGDERLKFGEIVAAMRFNERFDPLYYACDETLHLRPGRREAREEQARLAVVMQEAAATMTRAMEQLERLKTMPA